MLTDLALIDWIALVFAAVLLAAAAAAAVVAYATTKNRPERAEHRPAHAASSLGPQRAPSLAASPSMTRASAPIADVVSPARNGGTNSRQPELVGAPAHAADGQMRNERDVQFEPSSTEETVAARAAKLRGRPVPETDASHKRIVSAVEPKRMPAHAPNRAFAGAEAGPIAIDTSKSGQGFAARTPGFFEDPVGRHELRYWDGHRWTEYVKEHGERFTDPL